MLSPLPLAPAITPASTAPAVALAAKPRQSLIARPHTVLGVCEGIGEDLGFNPIYLRIAFAAGIFFAPAMVVAAYLALGVVVAASRWAFPVRSAAAIPAPAADAGLQAPVEAEQEYRFAA